MGFAVPLAADPVQVTCGVWRTRWRSPSSNSSILVSPSGGCFGVPDCWCFGDPPPNALCWVSTSHSVQPMEDTSPGTAEQRWPVPAHGLPMQAVPCVMLAHSRIANKAAMLYYAFSCDSEIFCLSATFLCTAHLSSRNVCGYLVHSNEQEIKI